MIIYLNLEAFELKTSKTIQESLAELRMQQQWGIAIAVNDSVIPKSDWASFALKDQDKLTVISATQGG